MRTDASFKNTQTRTQSTNASSSICSQAQKQWFSSSRQRVSESCQESVLNAVGLPACWARCMHREVVEPLKFVLSAYDGLPPPLAVNITVITT